MPDLQFGDVTLQMAERRLHGPSGSVPLEPRVVQVIAALAGNAGSALSRDALFDRCWNGLPVGDDSLNRAIYQARRAIRQVGSTAVSLHTVAAAGYVLETARISARDVYDAAERSWRAGRPQGDEDIIARLEAVLASGHADSAELWGMLALHLCRAAEYAPLDACAGIVGRCHAAASRALALDPTQTEAQVARSSLRPLYGDWSGCRTRLLAALAHAPASFVARHELAVLEMSTGCVSRAIPLIAALIEEDPFAATVQYKRGYHLYCLGRIDAMDRVLDNALQLWPRHPGLWQCRSMTLAFTGRAGLALQLLEDAGLRPPMPAPTLAFHRLALGALADGNRAAEAVAELADGARWQSMAVAAIMYLCALGDVDAAMAVCRHYYLRDGGAKTVRLAHEADVEASINEMHRRATQALFLPVTQALREHPYFPELCERMGLSEYWAGAGVRPDFAADSEVTETRSAR